MRDLCAGEQSAIPPLAKKQLKTPKLKAGRDFLNRARKPQAANEGPQQTEAAVQQIQSLGRVWHYLQTYALLPFARKLKQFVILSLIQKEINILKEFKKGKPT